MDSFDLTQFDADKMNEVIETATTYLTTYGLEVIGAIIILILGWWVAGKAQNLTTRALAPVKNADKTLTGFLAGTVRYLVLAVTIVAVLNRFGVETTSLIAVMGAAGLAIGLALQGTLSNVAAGVMLLFFRPFRVGHFVDIGGHMGTVKSLGLFITELTKIDNVQIIIPNSDIWGNPITNYSANKTRRLDVACGISYDSDIDKALEVFQKTIEKDERVLKDPEPQYFVESLGDSSVNIVGRIWLNASDFWPAKWDFNKKVKQALDKAGLDIPFPNRTVHLVMPEGQEIEVKKSSTKKSSTASKKKTAAKK